MASSKTLNVRGEWVEAISLPYRATFRLACGCGARFWTRRGYEGHYALVHVLGLGG